MIESLDSKINIMYIKTEFRRVVQFIRIQGRLNLRGDEYV